MVGKCKVVNRFRYPTILRYETRAAGTPTSLTRPVQVSGQPVFFGWGALDRSEARHGIEIVPVTS